MTSRLRRAARTALAAAVVVLLVACPADEAQRPPVAPDDGLQVSGVYGGRQLALSDGEPEVLYGDCDPQQGADTDLCIVASMLEGGSFALVFENPDVLTAGDSVSVADVACGDGGCDDIEDTAVVEVRVGTTAQGAVGGTVTVREADQRFAGSFVLRFTDGTLTGDFNVRPPATP